MTDDVHIVKIGPHQQDTIMFVDDIDIDKMIESNLSLGGINSLFGNSIVVDVMTEMFRTLFIDRKKNKSEELW